MLRQGDAEVEICPGEGWEEIQANSTLILTKAQEQGHLRLTTQDVRQLPEANFFPLWRVRTRYPFPSRSAPEAVSV